MSRTKRAIERQKKANSPARKAKQEKKRKYASSTTWDEKKAKKEAAQCSKREAKGISTECSLPGWQKPSIDNCRNCKIQKCSAYKSFKAQREAEGINKNCPLPIGEKPSLKKCKECSYETLYCKAYKFF